MTTDVRRETSDCPTDNHLADRARLGSRPAFDELVRRHADLAVAAAMVVTGDAQAAAPIGAQAFTDVLDRLPTRAGAVDDWYLPGLIRSTRKLALHDSAVDAARRDNVNTRLPELARSTRWLTAVVGLDAQDLALALDVDDHAVAGIVAWTDSVVADHAGAVDRLLAGVHVPVPDPFAAQARSIWRRSLTTATDGAPVAATGDNRGLVAIGPAASRLLQGAAVVLIVVGVVGACTAIALRSEGGSDIARIAQRASVERQMERTRTSGNNGSDESTAESALADADRSLPSTVTGPSLVPDPPIDDVPQDQVLGASINVGSSLLWNRAKEAVIGPPAAAANGGATTGSPPSSTAPPPGPAQPATPVAPGPVTSTQPPPTEPTPTPTPTPTMHPTTNPPVTDPPATIPPETVPPVTEPPATAPPDTEPPIALSPSLAFLLGTAAGAIGDLLGR